MESIFHVVMSDPANMYVKQTLYLHLLLSRHDYSENHFELRGNEISPQVSQSNWTLLHILIALLAGPLVGSVLQFNYILTCLYSLYYDYTLDSFLFPVWLPKQVVVVFCLRERGKVWACNLHKSGVCPSTFSHYLYAIGKLWDSNNDSNKIDMDNAAMKVINK